MIVGRIGAVTMAVWPALLAAPASANERGSASAPIAAREPVASGAGMAVRRPIDLRRLRLLPSHDRTRSYRLADAPAAGPGDDGRLRARVRGVRLWETSRDDAAFALGVSPVSGRLMGALRILR